MVAVAAVSVHSNAAEKLINWVQFGPMEKKQTGGNEQMKLHSKAILLVAAIALAACSNNGPGRYGAGAAGAGADALGAVSDPTSPAYFNQVVGDRVHFVVDQSTLSAEAQAILDGQAEWLLTNTDFNAVIEGHADEQGTREYNIALSERRAVAVMEYLVAKGVSSARLTTIPYGKERPIALCSDESCYTQNRRAVTVISAAGLG